MFRARRMANTNEQVKMEERVYRMLSAPLLFRELITPDQWQSLSDEDQDKIIEAYKVIAPITAYNPLAWPNQKLIIKDVLS